MSVWKYNIPDDKEDEIIESLCDTEFEPASKERADKAVADFILGKVETKRNLERPNVSVKDIKIT